MSSLTMLHLNPLRKGLFLNSVLGWQPANLSDTPASIPNGGRSLARLSLFTLSAEMQICTAIVLATEPSLPPALLVLFLVLRLTSNPLAFLP